MKTTRWLPILICLPLMAVRGHAIVSTSGRSARCIPFDSANRHVAFQARVNDRDGVRLLLDTGAGGSVLDAALSDVLGLEEIGTQNALGSGGSAMGSTVRGVDVAGYTCKGPGVSVPITFKENLPDMSGLGLVSIPPDLRRISVARVMDGSPAFEAGFRAGDEIQIVNGKPVEAIGLSALRETLRRAG